jgi:membrane protein
MNKLTKLVRRVDTFQRNHTTFGFLYAVIKKYSQDNCGYLSAVISYYGFLSLFPLLVVVTSLAKLLFKNDASLKNRIINSTVHYFPIVGNQLQRSIHSPKETGIALIISLIIMLYGARGVASTLQFSISSIWYVPQFKMPSFITGLVRSVGIMAVGGVGLLAASVVSGYTVISSHAIIVRVLTAIASLLILWLTFIFIFKLAIASRKRVKQVIIGAAISAIGLVVLQTLGGLIMVHELKGLSSVYGTFALVVGILFWIYLQAEIILYAVEVDVIRDYHLFPRSLQGVQTDSDKLAELKRAESSRQRANQKVAIDFTK